MKDTSNITTTNEEKEHSLREEERIRKIKVDTIAEYNSLGVRESSSKSKTTILLIVLLISIGVAIIASMVKYKKTIHYYDNETTNDIEYNIESDDDTEYIEIR